MKAILEISDNPLAGAPGQPDVNIVLSSDPDLELPKDGSLPDPDTLPLSIMVAAKAISAVADATLETTFIAIARGDFN